VYERAAAAGSFAGAVVMDRFDAPVKGVEGLVSAVRLVASGE
jgi:hypothetical protein